MIGLRRERGGGPGSTGRVEPPKGSKPRLVSVLVVCLALFLCAPSAPAADETILLDEAQFLGRRRVMPEASDAESIERPALSTFLAWEGDQPVEFNIPQEILNDLTRPDLSYFSGPGVDGEEREEMEIAQGE